MPSELATLVKSGLGRSFYILPEDFDE